MRDEYQDGAQISRFRSIRDLTNHAHALVDNERNYRSATLSAEPLVLAFDFDVVHGYLFPSEGDQGSREAILDAARLVAAVLQRQTDRFTLLPGSVTEMMQVLPHLLQRIDPPAWYQPLPEQTPLAAEHRERLSAAGNHAAVAAFVFRRASSLLKAPNYVDALDVFHDPDLLFHDSESVQRYSNLLAQLRPRHAPSNAIDSINLAIIARALKDHLPLTFVTRSPTVRTAFDLVSRETTTAALPAAVLSPRLALFRLGLSRASLAEVSEIVTQLDAVSTTISMHEDALLEQRASSVSGVALTAISTAERSLGSMMSSFIDLHVAVNQAWEPPLMHMPPSVDLGILANAVNDAIADAKRELENLVEVAAETARLASRICARLDPSSQTDRTHVNAFAGATIETAYFIQPGGSATNHNVTQTGGNLVAVVGDANATVTNVIANDLRDAMRHLVASVERSPLSETDKRAVLEQLTEVERDVNKHGKLIGRAKIVWAGIKEIIGVVPSAMAAWQAVSKFLK